MILTTTEIAHGHKVTKILGIARGNIAQGTGSIAALGATMAQQEVEEYSLLIEAARREAEKRMLDHARRLDADAVLGVRYEMGNVGTAHAVEVLCYGTAVKMRPE